MTNEMAKKGTYVGTGIGLILFVLVGMFPGSLIGGAIGLKISSLLFGAVKATLVPRMIVALSMLAGVLGSAAVFVIGTSVAGWMVGTAADAVKRSKAAIEMEEARAKSH